MDYTTPPRAPWAGGQGRPIAELVDVLGGEVFDHPEEHGFGECDAETMQQLRRARGAPETLVRIYRALPPGLGQINAGDWITLSWEYARQHAMRDDTAAHDWPIVYADVPAWAVLSDGTDLDEYGYAGPPLAGLEDHVVDP
ncbi:hypothetical protein [Sinomonas albida]|uniref:hypothetical protein n=1 Tax=Sinomonas albida TaxID=369942 RepID=UPI0010A8E93A|nr:hypothetical protein [Sinomonas albida]